MIRLKSIFIIGLLMSCISSKGQAVGIGTSSFTPNNMLEIRGGGNTASDSVFQVRNSSANPLFYVNGVGNVGIGTINPLAKLDVKALGDAIYYGTGSVAYSTTPLSTAANLVGRGGTADYRISVDPNSSTGRVNHYWNAYSDAAGTWKYIAGSEPAVRLMMTSNGSTGGQLGFYGAPNTGIAGSAITWTQTALISSGDQVWFSPRGTSSDFYISSGGNVGIGTTNPSTTKLEVKGSSGSTIKIVDGNQGAGKVLVSDANGVGTWQASTTVGGANLQSVYFTSGTGSTWSVPSNVTLVWVTMWGGGGGGTFSGNPTGGGGGGSGEVILRYPLKVTAGGTLTYTVGAGGTGGSGATPGADGGGSQITGFNGGAILIAKGGGGSTAVASGKGGGSDSLIAAAGSGASSGVKGLHGPWFIGGSSGGQICGGCAGYAGGNFFPYTGGAAGSGSQSGGGGAAGFNGNGIQGATNGNNGSSAAANSGAGGGGAGGGSGKTGGNGGSGGIIIQWVAP